MKDEMREKLNSLEVEIRPPMERIAEKKAEKAEKKSRRKARKGAQGPVQEALKAMEKPLQLEAKLPEPTVSQPGQPEIKQEVLDFGKGDFSGFDASSTAKMPKEELDKLRKAVANIATKIDVAMWQGIGNFQLDDDEKDSLYSSFKLVCDVAIKDVELNLAIALVLLTAAHVGIYAAHAEDVNAGLKRTFGKKGKGVELAGEVKEEKVEVVASEKKGVRLA